MFSFIFTHVLGEGEREMEGCMRSDTRWGERDQIVYDHTMCVCVDTLCALTLTSWDPTLCRPFATMSRRACWLVCVCTLKIKKYVSLHTATPWLRYAVRDDFLARNVLTIFEWPTNYLRCRCTQLWTHIHTYWSSVNSSTNPKHFCSILCVFFSIIAIDKQLVTLFRHSQIVCVLCGK